MSTLSLFSKRLLLSELTQKALEEEYMMGCPEIMSGLFRNCFGNFEWIYVVRTCHPMIFLWQNSEYSWEKFHAIYENINNFKVLTKSNESFTEWKQLEIIMRDGVKCLTNDEKIKKTWRDYQYLKSEQHCFDFYQHQEDLEKFHNPNPAYIPKELFEESVFDNPYKAFIPQCCIVEPQPENYCFRNIYLQSLGNDMDFGKYLDEIQTVTQTQQEENLDVTPKKIPNIEKKRKYEMPDISPKK